MIYIRFLKCPKTKSSVKLFQKGQLLCKMKGICECSINFYDTSAPAAVCHCCVLILYRPVCDYVISFWFRCLSNQSKWKLFHVRWIFSVITAALIRTMCQVSFLLYRIKAVCMLSIYRGQLIYLVKTLVKEKNWFYLHIKWTFYELFKTFIKTHT